MNTNQSSPSKTGNPNENKQTIVELLKGQLGEKKYRHLTFL